MRYLLFAAAIFAALWLATADPPPVAPLPALATAVPPEPVTYAEPIAYAEPVTAVALPAAWPHLHPSQPTTGGDYSAWGGVLRYCWFGQWAQADRATMLAGLDAWKPAGVRFAPADDFATCTLLLTAENGGDNGNGGYASMGPGMWGRLPGRITINSYYPLSQWTATHETGHVLGLLHWERGIMAETVDALTPGDAEIAAVRAMWGTP